MEPTSVESVTDRPARRARPLASLGIITVIVLVVGIIGAFAIGGSGGGDVSKIAARPASQVVMDSAAATAKAGSAQFDMKLSIDVQLLGQHEQAEVDATGALDFANRKGHITETIPAADGSKLTLDMIIDGDTVYVGGPAVAAKLPAGKTYVKVDAATLAGGMTGGASNPADALQSLNQVSSDVHEVGRETVNGADTVHYAATLDPSKAPAVSGLGGQLGAVLGSFTVPVDVWIDGEGRTRRMRTSIDMAKMLGGLAALGGNSKGSGSGAGGVTMQLDLSDFGKTVDVTVPPASSVADASTIPGLAGAMGGMFGGAGHP